MVKLAKKIASKKKAISTKEKSMTSVIKERQTEELVLALCGSVGSGTSTIANKVTEILTEYNYRVHVIKISDLISKHIGLVRADLEKDEFLNGEYH